MMPGAEVTALWRGGGDNMHLDLFVTDRGGSVWTTYWEPKTGWAAWFVAAQDKAGKAHLMAPAAPVTGAWRRDHLDIFAVDRDGLTYHAYWEPRIGWSQWNLFFKHITGARWVAAYGHWDADSSFLLIPGANRYTSEEMYYTWATGTGTYGPWQLIAEPDDKHTRWYPDTRIEFCNSKNIARSVATSRYGVPWKLSVDSSPSEPKSPWDGG
ncbi:hypothetical protein VHEMI05899 [[Torrubiella] hemipterigena]|uniref:Uncharacterized protein n=1 Tax=[Torrubiella] hemipterigena TaxID=1531966 RepID=A0A0A1TI45_9HYPO|nr:hypothetical protein VHEMI05899 [[Torrubiella] hemipterigena]